MPTVEEKYEETNITWNSKTWILFTVNRCRSTTSCLISKRDSFGCAYHNLSYQLSFNEYLCCITFFVVVINTTVINVLVFTLFLVYVINKRTWYKLLNCPLKSSGQCIFLLKVYQTINVAHYLCGLIFVHWEVKNGISLSMLMHAAWCKWSTAWAFESGCLGIVGIVPGQESLLCHS